MSERRRARASTAGAAGGVVPLELVAGPCVEVWTDRHVAESGRGMETLRRFRQARTDWGAAHGLHMWDTPVLWPPSLVFTGASPWSFRYLAEFDPDRLATIMATRGLRADWSPRFVAAWDYGPSLVPAAMTFDRWRQWRSTATVNA